MAAAVLRYLEAPVVPVPSQKNLDEQSPTRLRRCMSCHNAVVCNYVVIADLVTTLCKRFGSDIFFEIE